LTVDVEDFGWDRYRDVYVEVDARLRDELLTVSNLFVEWDADPILRASATLPVPVRSLLLGRSIDDVPLQARMQLEPLPLTKLSPFDYTFAYLKGQLAAYLTLGGTLRDPEFAARVALTDTHLSRQDRATVALQVTGRDDRVRMATTICRNDRTVLAGRASAPVNLDPIDVAVAGEPLLLEGPLEGYFKGERVPLANVVPPALTQGLAEELAGTFSIDMTLDGTWDTPKPTGTIAVRDGAVTLPSYGRRFRDIQFRSSIDREAMEISKLHVADDNGSIAATATVPFETFTPSGLTADIEADDFDLTGFAAGYTAFVSGDIDATGDFTEATYGFDVDVAGLEVDLPESQPRGSYPTALDNEIVVASRRGETSQVLDLDTLTGGPDSGASYEVKVDIDLDRRSWVRHPNGDVNFTGAVDVTMTPTILTLTGGVNTLRGDFEFLGRDFSIPNKTDVIRFTGASPPNPRLNIEAIHPLDQNIAEEIGQATGGEPQIVVRVSGSATEPRLSMESDPGMTESEIIFVLMTGRPPSDAGVGEDQGVASQAVAAASGLFAGLLQQQLRGSFPVDMVRLETGSNGLGNSRLRVGKYITTNLFVSSAYQFAGQDDEGGFETRVEYHFLPSWMVEAKYGDDNTGEFNVFWDLY
jgi:translocation and assembly module TamB